MTEPLDNLGSLIADALGETTPQACAQIDHMARYLGPIVMWALVDAVRSIETQGGMQRKDGSRRTLGGVFFKLTSCGFPSWPRWWNKDRRIKVMTAWEREQKQLF